MSRMGYAVIAVVVLVALGLLGRVVNRRLQPASFPASELLRRPPLVATFIGNEDTLSDLEDLPGNTQSGPHRAQGITVKLQAQSGIAAPGAPNTDVPSDRHVCPQGTATITRRTGRRRSTTSSTSATL